MQPTIEACEIRNAGKRGKEHVSYDSNVFLEPNSNVASDRN